MKHGLVKAHAVDNVSRPSRARGLKHRRVCSNACIHESRPSRARGLKRSCRGDVQRYHAYVAPLAGAWVETSSGWLFLKSEDESRPSRARGLKQTVQSTNGTHAEVAPLAGAWVETKTSMYISNVILSRAPRGRVGGNLKMMISIGQAKRSRPSRARGLKHRANSNRHKRRWSRPSRARGLKLIGTNVEYAPYVSRPSRARGLKP